MSRPRHFDYPKLRWPLEVQYDDVDGRRIIILSCPLGLTAEPLGLNAIVAPILQQFQGKLSLAQIHSNFEAAGCNRELLEQLVQLLESHYFLESPNFTSAFEKMKGDFVAASERLPFLAGLSYHGGERELQGEIDEYLTNNLSIPVPQKSVMLGLMSPHIDYRRGGVCYGITWNQVRQHDHDLYLLMGTSHQYSEHMFHLSSKNFITPLGVLDCDRFFVQKVADSYGPVRSFTDEYLHRREHSLELQTPFLKRLKHAPRIAPILVGSFHHMLRAGKPPQEFAVYEDFIGALTEAMSERVQRGERVCVVAGVDMAHVGSHFGDTMPLSKEFMAEIERRDRMYLDAIMSKNKEALWNHIEEDLDARRICGFPTMYTVMDLFERLKLPYSCQLYDYRQAVDYRTQCAVTFGGMGFYI